MANNIIEKALKAFKLSGLFLSKPVHEQLFVLLTKHGVL
jgi:hypothetical protein